MNFVSNTRPGDPRSTLILTNLVRSPFSESGSGSVQGLNASEGVEKSLGQ